MKADCKIYITEQARTGLQALAQVMGPAWTVETLVEHAGIAVDGLADEGDLGYVAGVVRNFLAEEDDARQRATGYHPSEEMQALGRVIWPDESADRGDEGVE